MNYTLNINEDQARLISAALDLYMRVGMGQLTEILQHPTIIAAKDVADSEILEAKLREVKQTIFKDLPSGAYHGIRSEKIDDSNRAAYDLYQVVRNRLAWDGLTVAEREQHNKVNSRPVGVWFDEPYQTSTKTPLASIAGDYDGYDDYDDYDPRDIDDDQATLEITAYITTACNANRSVYQDTVADALNLPLRQVCKIVDKLV